MILYCYIMVDIDSENDRSVLFGMLFGCIRCISEKVGINISVHSRNYRNNPVTVYEYLYRLILPYLPMYRDVEIELNKIVSRINTINGFTDNRLTEKWVIGLEDEILNLNNKFN